MIDPASGQVIDYIFPLLSSLGYEVGLRGFWHERLKMSLALWALGLDSKLVFASDEGGTEADMSLAWRMNRHQ